MAYGNKPEVTNTPFVWLACWWIAGILIWLMTVNLPVESEGVQTLENISRLCGGIGIAGFIVIAWRNSTG